MNCKMNYLCVLTMFVRSNNSDIMTFCAGNPFGAQAQLNCAHFFEQARARYADPCPSTVYSSHASHVNWTLGVLQGHGTDHLL